ncbi:MAG: hypothetical protein VZQ98_15895 [Bacteroidales bacterium]|nr:hypothetical protein [Bacteroidales bacterium]
MIDQSHQPEIKTDNLNKETKSTLQNDNQQRENLSSQDGKTGVFGLNSLIMYIPVCAVSIFVIVVKGNESLTMKIVWGFLCGFVVWLIAALVGSFDKKGKE